MTSSQLTIALLGEPQLRAPGAEPVVPQAGRVTALLALLALEPSRVVSTEHLIEQLWDDEPPASAVSTLYVYVSRLRKQLAPLGVAVTTRPGGYSLDVAAESIDLVRFSRAVESADSAARAGDWAAAAASLELARGLWRSIPFQGAIPTSDLQLERQRLERLRHRVDELDARTLLERGDAAEAAERARALTDLEPLNESYWLLRMDAEHRAGNTAVALSVFEEFRELVADALGIDPGPRLRELHARLLREPAPVVAAEDSGTVGRAAARADIDRAVRGARAGRGRTVILEGPTGVGKTHLAEVAARSAAEEGVHVVWAKAPDGGAPSLWNVRELLGSLPGGTDDSGASRLATLVEATSAVDDVDQSRLMLAEAIVGEAVAASARQPILVVLDDVQWADATTVHVLRLLAARLRSLPVSLLITARLPESRRPDIAAALLAIAGSESTTRHTIAPLTEDEVGQLPRARGLSDERIHELWQRTGGNAYFVTALLASGDPDALPSSVGDLLVLRADALRPEARAVLDLAAVGGESLDVAVLGIAAGGGAVVLEAVEGGLAHGILASRDGGYRFAHSLARDALLGAIPLIRRTQLHAAYADGIEQLPDADSDDRLQELAEHRYRAAAGVPDERAYAACLAAADSARATLAFDLAALFRKRALEMLPPGPEAEAARARLLVLLTSEQRDAGDVQSAAGTLRRARCVGRCGPRRNSASARSPFGRSAWSAASACGTGGSSARLIARSSSTSTTSSPIPASAIASGPSSPARSRWSCTTATRVIGREAGSCRRRQWLSPSGSASRHCSPGPSTTGSSRSGSRRMTMAAARCSTGGSPSPASRTPSRRERSSPGCTAAVSGWRAGTLPASSRTTRARASSLHCSAAPSLTRSTRASRPAWRC